MSPEEKLAFIEDIIKRGNSAFQMDYDCRLVIDNQDSEGKIRVVLFDGDDVEVNTVTVDVVNATVRMKVMDEWADVNMDLLQVYMGAEGVRIMNASPHNLFAVMYA